MMNTCWDDCEIEPLTAFGFEERLLSIQEQARRLLLPPLPSSQRARFHAEAPHRLFLRQSQGCLLYTSDAADE